MSVNPYRSMTGLFSFAGLILGSSVIVAPIPASAQTAKPLPPEVRAYFDKARRECSQEGDRLHVQDESSFAEPADFNGDGRTDYVVHLASLVCPSLGYSEYCGSAGCMVSILVSQGDRLREVVSENYQGLAISKPVGGKQTLAFAAHGTFCGHKTGADTCFGVMSWTPAGFKTTYVRTEPAALKAQAAADGANAADSRPDKNPRYDWKLIKPAAGKQGATIAMSDALPDGTKTVIACAERMPVIVVAFPPGPKAPPPGVPLMVEIGEPRSNDAHADLVLQQVKGQTAYIGQLSRAALTILQKSAGNQEYAVVPQAWTTANRDYWIDMPALPLTHFNDTTRAALGTCTAGLR